MSDEECRECVQTVQTDFFSKDSIRIGQLISPVMPLWSRYSVILAAAQKFQTCARARAPDRPGPLPRSCARPWRSKKRRSQESECQYCPFGLRLLPAYLPSFLPSSVFFRSFSLGKENLEWIEGFGFWIHFHMLQPFKRGLPLDWVNSTLSNSHTFSRSRQSRPNVSRNKISQKLRVGTRE